MQKQMICPPAAETVVKALKMSPAILSGGFLFSTGMVGLGRDGQMPADAATQFDNVFEKIGGILREAELDFDAVVEMTSYHIGLRDHFELFDAVRLRHFREPYPAWTAIEAGGLRREGALVEVRFIANAQGN